MHLGDLIQDAGASDAPFLLDARSTAQLSYAQFAAAVQAWQPMLAGTDRVLLDIADPLSFAVAHLSVIAGGRDSIPIDPAAPVPDIERTLRRTEPDLILSDRVQRWPNRPVIDVTEPRESPVATVQKPSATGGVLMQTSGSTGEPKLIRLNEQQLLTVAGEVASHHRLSSRDRGYNPLPLFHINAQVVALLATLVAGGSLVLDQRFHRNGFWPLITKYHVTWINGVPAIWTILARDELPHHPARLRFVRSASAPLPLAIRTEIQRGLGVPVIESYGMTEAASQITATDLDSPAPDGSAGRPITAQVQIRNDGGDVESPGSIGRIWLRGPGIITSYFQSSASTKFDANGWLDTGDLGCVDAQGYLFLNGRADDVINRGGELVYPREIEEVLLRDDRVRDAVVIGRAHDTLGAVPVALLLLQEPETPAAALIADLQDLCSTELSRFKHPAEFEIVQSFPRASVGKIRRHLLREASGT